jgi:hypothetical protein
MKQHFTAGLAALLLASVGQAALAGTIVGTVMGSDGAPFRAAFVRVQNLKTKVTMMVLSDNQGRYWTDPLDAGTYQVSATAVGYRSDPVRRNNVTVEESRLRKRATLSTCLQQSLSRWSPISFGAQDYGTRTTIWYSRLQRMDVLMS